jgi:alanine racemase
LTTRATPTRRFFRPTWAEVDLGVVRANLKTVRARVGRKTKLMFVVKANAYGHGALACAKAGEPLVDWLGVSSVEEGAALRDAGVKKPVLVLGSLYPFESFLAAAEYNLTPTIASMEGARRLVEAAARVKRPLDCHLKIDTGMGRIGVSPAASGAVAQFLSGQKSVRMAGVYTHLASAEDDPDFTREQLRRFKEALSVFPPNRALKHAANSAAALKFPAARLDLVRPGGAVYGLCMGLPSALSLKSKIVFLKTVPPGTTVGYGATFKAKRAARIATVPVGYADGYPRALSNKGLALVGGRPCPIVGRVSMDMLTLDVTDNPQARVGEDVVLIGEQNGHSITAEDLAKQLGTISYEVTCALTARVPRVYVG